MISHGTSAGRRSRIHYDLAQRLTCVEEDDGIRREHQWNADYLAQRALPREFIDAQDGHSRLTYDTCHGVIAQQDALGQVSRYERDELGQVTAFINAHGGISHFTYN